MADRAKLAAAFQEAQAEIAMQAQQKLTDAMLKHCFRRCVASPDARLSDKQRRCLDDCTSSFMEGFSIASETLASMAKKSGAE